MVQSTTHASSSTNIRSNPEDEEAAYLAASANTNTNDDGEEMIGSIDPRTLFTTQELEEIEDIKSTPDLYARIIESVAPAIYGHPEIKAGILLMLFGGVHKVSYHIQTLCNPFLWLLCVGYTRRD